jgi:dATP pyrophosphohydrolase
MRGIIFNYVEVHIAFKNESNYEFLLIKRSEKDKVTPGIWQMVTGGIKENESIKEGVLREVSEETGIIPSVIYSIPRVNSFYFDYGDAICLSPVFLAISDSKGVKLSEEHTNYKWVSYDDAIELIRWPDQIESLTLIKKYLDNNMLFKKLFKIKG